MTAPIFATLGCRLNAYETEAMKELAAAAGLSGAVVVNTCAVTAEAVRKANVVDAGAQGFVELIHPQTDVAPGIHPRLRHQSMTQG